MSALAGRLAVVTGASRGIGAAVAAALATAGARIVGVSRSAGAPSAGRHVACDVTDPGQVLALARMVIEEEGVPDLLVNVAGTFSVAPFVDTEVAELQRQLAVNLVAPFAVVRAFLPAMLAAGRGHLIAIGSVADHVGFPDNSAYTASKYGLRGMHEALRAELRGSGVRATLVSPGATDTAVWDPIDPDHRPGYPARAAMLRPADVAEAILFVASRPAHVDVDWLRLGPA